MDTRLLKFFVAVYEEKNLTKAAGRCFVSQPNISNGIKQLEETLGKELFVRHKRGVELTVEAHYLYPVARRLLGELSALPGLFHEKLFRHKISIGITESLPQEYKQRFLQKTTALIEDLEWNIGEVSRACDINLLVREWKAEEDLFLPLWKENYVLCIPDGHPLLEKESIAIEDLAGENFIHCPPCEAHKQCLSILNADVNPMQTIAHCSSKTETLSCVMAGLGLSFLPEAFAEGWSGFQIRPYKGPQYFREVGLAYPRKSLKNPAIAKLVNYFSSNRF